jgi:prepilin-type N-terminal cleavage/methylation domain-containing protein
MHSKKSRSYFSPAFTIVELLVVIVVIAILATITIVSYTGITKQATTSSVQSNLKQLTTTIDLDHATNSTYPATSSAINSGKGFPQTSGITYFYNSLDNNTNYCASATGSGITYHYTPKDGQIKTGDCGSLALSCPAGFIPVPGSSTYSTSNFCVMKYAASQVGSTTTPISQAGSTPWVNISQTTAIANSPNVAGCTGCHLITEAEWMTIAQNVLGVASNWSGGAVGSGYIYSGHNDNSPANSLATSSDSDPYSGTGNNSSSGANQKRTLTLSNGEVIWDLAGNVWEWTAGQTTGHQPGYSTDTGYNWRRYNDSSLLQNSFPSTSLPASTGLSGITWNSSAGIGQLYSHYGDTSLHGFIRGGRWSSGNTAGVLTLHLSNSPSNMYDYIGFRVSQ